MAVKYAAVFLLCSLAVVSPLHAQTMEDLIRRGKAMEKTGKDVDDLGKAHDAVQFYIKKHKEGTASSADQQACRKALGVLLQASGENEEHTEKNRPANSKEQGVEKNLSILQRIFAAFDNSAKAPPPTAAENLGAPEAGEGRQLFALFQGFLGVVEAVKGFGQKTGASVQIASLRVEADLKPDAPHRLLCGETLQDQVKKLLPF